MMSELHDVPDPRPRPLPSGWGPRDVVVCILAIIVGLVLLSFCVFRFFMQKEASAEVANAMTEILGMLVAIIAVYVGHSFKN